MALVLAASPLSAVGDALWLPGALLSWEGAETVPSVGVSLKRFADVGQGAVSFGSFETRFKYSDSTDSYRIDVSWPNVFGFLYPGVSFDVAPDRVEPWLYGEVDLFYFPFAFVTMVLFGQPVVIPSVYFAFRANTSDQLWETGFRVSFPIYGAAEQ